jgi:CheY-like chemotaxis protein
MSTKLKNLCVLVVDDEADHANTLAHLLKQFGYDAHTCVHSRDCMEAVERLRPHVILLDLSMPGMTGFDIADEIQENPDLRPARLIAVTGRSQDLDRLRTSVRGFDYHLV